MEDFQDKLHLLTENTFMDDSLYKTLENDESIQKFVKLDLKQKLLLQENAKRINNIKPYERPDKDHISTLFNYRTQYESNKKEQNKNGCSIRSSFISTKQHSSHKELCDLKPINLKDMKVNKIHYGYYLKCKTIVEPFYIAGMNLLIEDKNGNIENLILYNYSLRSYQIDPNNLIPQGTKLLIKEPFLKLFASAEKEFGIRVDSPTDILIINDEAKKSLDKIIEDGNLQFPLMRRLKFIFNNKINCNYNLKYFSKYIKENITLKRLKT
jgi:hypothetical protein